jgi:ABC-type antimicrobial peptide transport system permease subunit
LYVHISPAASFATNLLVRFEGPPDPTRRAVSLAVQSELGTSAPVYTVLLTEELDRLQGGYRGRYQLLSVMGWIAAILSGLGMFGVGSYTVARRRRELALRMAVGASRGRILSACLSDLIIAASVGVAAGLTTGVLMGRSANHLLYGVTPWDPIVFGGVLSLLGAMVVAGAFMPIRDAWRTDVSAVLRQEC